MNLLNWSHWRIIQVEENDLDFRITAQLIDSPAVCISCGTVGELRPYGARAQRFMDLPIQAKRTGLIVERRRLKCHACGKLFIEPLADMDEHYKMTKRLLTFVRSESLRRTFTDVAERCGLDEKTVRSVFRAYVSHLEKEYQFNTPSVLGIDELHLLGKPRCVLTNVEYRTMIDLLEKRDQQTVQKYLSNIKDGHKIEVVTMDMWRPYRLAVEAVLPNAIIVVDKFHIVRMANQALEQVRKNLRESLTDRQRRTLKRDRFILLHRRHDLDDKDRLILETWTDNFPDLGKAYELKEAFFDIWNTDDKKVAWERYTEWQTTIPTDMKPQFKEIITAVKNWKDAIFNYFDAPVTNAYTEALNGIMKIANRNGRGYSFEAIRAKMLYQERHMYRRSYRNGWQTEIIEPEPVVQLESDAQVEPQDEFTQLKQTVKQAVEAYFENMGVPLSTAGSYDMRTYNHFDSTTFSE